MKRVLIVLLFYIPFILNGATYYVATTGNNSNSGDITHPWLTWQKAFDEAEAGDTVYFRGGVYYITGGVGGLGVGTRANPICFFNYPGEVPILDGINKTSPSEGLMLYLAEFNHLKGLVVRNNFQIQSSYQDAHGIYVYDCKNIRIENCVSYNNGKRGIAIGRTDTTYIINCDAYNNCDSLTSGYEGGSGDGFFVMNERAADATSYVLLRGCRAWHNSDDGFDTWSEGRVVYDRCWAINNGYLNGDGNGFKFGFKYLSTPTQPLDRQFTNCVAAYNGKIAGNTGQGFTENNNNGLCMTLNVFNCISYNNADIGFCTYSSCSPEKVNTYKNNIAYADGRSMPQLSGEMTSSYNSWETPPGVTLSDADFVSVDSAGITAARQADGSLPDNDCYNEFLRIATGSDLIDAGVDVGLPYDGDAPDLGFAEYAEAGASDATDILTFTFTEQTGSATINATLHTVSIEVEWDAVITSLTPTITVSGGATIDPTSGTARNFTSPVTYTVTAEDTVTEQEWTVTVTQEAEPSSAIKLLKKGIRLLKKGTKFLK